MKIEEVDDDMTGSVVEIGSRSGGKNCGGKDRSLIVVRIDAKRALVGAGARILFYPTLLYNVFRNKIQSEFRWWDEIDQFLLLGAVPFPKDVPRLKQLGVGGVITLNEPYETLVPTSLYYAHEIDHLVIPTRDYLFAPSFLDINRAVDFIHRNASAGRTTYVHCKAGRGRSTTVVLCYLVEYKHMSPATAFEYVRSRRPRVLLAPSQWKAVQEYQQQRTIFKGTCMPGDAVFITKADLEGYDSRCDRNRGKELSLKPKMARGNPMIARLSCLFSSLKVSGNSGPVMRRLTEAPAC
ncbi:phosphatidylglycerophosphate phosphatase PTPMT2-like [Andrographis paniculata]|uniref:phosphatidylglycerophosphate phosphatase PTPMT2-like n=1 Tax=Andrographis paniculata TaxID=175694 RepID=UPI0021E902B9|nr:phosphatidylglycerophosphate phosphatase PTPMT2-like [Andrographis paniculata]